MSKINVYSEIGRLKKVMLHRPGDEIDGVIPRPCRATSSTTSRGRRGHSTSTTASRTSCGQRARRWSTSKTCSGNPSTGKGAAGHSWSGSWTSTASITGTCGASWRNTCCPWTPAPWRTKSWQASGRATSGNGGCGLLPLLPRRGVRAVLYGAPGEPVLHQGSRFLHRTGHELPQHGEAGQGAGDRGLAAHLL